MVGLFRNNPILRVLIPVIIGIILYISEMPLLFSFIIFVVGILLYIIAEFLKSKFPYYHISLTLIITSLAWINAWIITPTDDGNNFKNTSHIFTRIDEITDYESSIRVIGTIIGATDTTNTLIKDIPNYKISLLIQGSNYRLVEGDVILFKPHIKRIKNFCNPDEFDYKQYMGNKGIFLTQFVPEKGYCKIGTDKTIFTEITKIRRKIVNHILSTNLSPQSQQFLITVLLGDKHYLSQDVQDNFSDIGLSHILALSGLHVGIITVIIFFLLFPLDYMKGKKIRIIITIIILLLYALLTGLSPSVLRAVIMFLFVGCSMLLYRGNSSINSILGSALFILIISPITLLDIGFQLSYAAVISIVLFSGLLNPISRKRKVSYYITSIIIVSISAVLGTGILSAYYFHSFPIIFLLPNVIIVPLLPIIIGLGIFSIIFPFDFAANIFNSIINIIFREIENLSQLEFAKINLLEISAIEIAIYFIMLATIYMWLKNKEIRYFIASLSLLILLNISFIISNYRVPYNEGFVVFNNRHETPIFYYRDGKGFLFPKDTALVDITDFERYNTHFLARRKIEEIKCSYPSSRIDNRYHYVMGKRVAIVYKSMPRKARAKRSLNVDYLILQPSFYGSIKRLITFYTPKLIIIPGAIFESRANEIIGECNALGIKYQYLNHSGAFKIER